MQKNLRYAVIAAVACLIIVPIGYTLIAKENAHFAIAVLMEIAVIGFFTVLFVMLLGSQHSEYPTEAKDSAAVAAWAERLAAAEKKAEAAEE